MTATLPRSISLAELVDSWMAALRAAHKSPHTMRCYRAGVQAYLDYCQAEGIPAELTKANVIAWLASRGGEASTNRLHLTTLKLFARWLADEEGFNADPILAVKAPKLDQAAVADLAESELRRMVKVCDGPTLRDKRDKAALTLLTETGLRAAELLALDAGDIDIIGWCGDVRLRQRRQRPARQGPSRHRRRRRPLLTGPPAGMPANPPAPGRCGSRHAPAAVGSPTGAWP